jgi:hypothetical protein
MVRSPLTFCIFLILLQAFPPLSISAHDHQGEGGSVFSSAHLNGKEKDELRDKWGFDVRNVAGISADRVR